LIPILVVLTLLMSLVAIVPTFAVQGEISFFEAFPGATDEVGDEISWSSPGMTVFIQLDDPDLDVAADITDAPDANGRAGRGVGYTFAVNASGEFIDGTATNNDLRLQIAVSDSPILDRNGDGRVNQEDVTVSLISGGTISGSLGVFSVDGNNGLVTLTSSVGTIQPDDLDAGNVKLFRLQYEAAGEDTVGLDEEPTGANFAFTSQVRVTSNADEQGIGVRLSEINEDTGATVTTGGIFGVMVELCTSDTTATCSAAAIGNTNPRIQVAANATDTVTVTYDDPRSNDRDVSRFIRIENEDPQFSNFSPAHLIGTIDDRPTVSADVTDGGSGVLQDEDGEETIMVVLRTVDVDGGQLVQGGVEDPSEDGTVTDISSGFQISQRVPRIYEPAGSNAPDTYFIQWWVMAEDLAGNLGVSDSGLDKNGNEVMTADADPVRTPCNTGNFDIHEAGANNGGCEPYLIRVDGDAPEFERVTTGNWWDTEREGAARYRTGANGINTSIEVEFDEVLDGETVSLSDFDSDDVTITGAAWFSARPKSVFLTTREMDSDETPEIELVGVVSDPAGNTVRNLTELARNVRDGIPPTLTVTVTGGQTDGRAITNDEITIAIESDEGLAGRPALTVHRINADGKITGSPVAANVRLVGTREWEAEFDPGSAGLYNVYVSGTDLGDLSIEGAKGVDGGGGAVVTDSNSAILFEVDETVSEPATSPEDDGESDNPDLFVSINFADEGNEYPKDSYKTVTITEATLTSPDGTESDIAGAISSNDGVRHLWKGNDLALGEYTVTITAEDAAGNELEDFDFSFEIIQPSLFEIELIPGWNLISLPNSPSDPSIDAVIPSSLNVDTVLTFDANTQGSPWGTAIRNADTGLFEGNLTRITAGTAYWVQTSEFESLEVSIPSLAAGQQQTPPDVMVSAGWNLVPVLDISGNKNAGDTLDETAGQYLSGVGFSRIYGYSPVDHAFTAVNSTDALKVGQGYWVFFTEGGIIVP
jgi:hypothetical protein